MYYLDGDHTKPFMTIQEVSSFGGNLPVSNTLAESYANVLLPCRIEKVIFHDPATIVYWKDKTKTVVKCHNEPFDREKGLAMCIAKKVLGDKFHQVFREWCGGDV